MGRAVPGLRLAWWGLGLNLGLAALKIAGGAVWASQAVLADGVHSLSDAAGSAAVLYGRRVAADPPDEEHPYGHEKAESLAAFATGLLLLAAALSIAWEAAARLLAGSPGGPGLPAVGIAVVAILVKEYTYRRSRRAARAIGSAGLEANAADSRADVWSSAAALLGVALARAGWRWADPAMALAVSALLVASGGRLARGSLHELLEGRSSAIEGAVRRAALGVRGVEQLHGLRTRTMGRFILVDLKIGVDGRMSVSEGHAVAGAVAAAVHAAAPPVREVLVHVNPARPDAAGPAGGAAAPGGGKAAPGGPGAPGDPSPLEVALGICLREDRVLLQWREREPFAGFWALPGGKREAGEGLAGTCRRELAEELGAAVEVGGLLLLVDETLQGGAGGGPGRCVLGVFPFRWPASAALPAGLRWFRLQDLGGLRMIPTDRRFVLDVAGAPAGYGGFRAAVLGPGADGEPELASYG